MTTNLSGLPKCWHIELYSSYPNGRLIIDVTAVTMEEAKELALEAARSMYITACYEDKQKTRNVHRSYRIGEFSR